MSIDNTYDPHNPHHTNPEDDDYGLPESEYDPVARPEENTYYEPEEETYTPPRREIEVKQEESNSNAAVWIVLVVLLLIAGGAIWYFMFNDNEPPVVEAPPKVEQPAEPEVTYTEPVEAPVEEEPEQTWVQPAQGSLSTINSPTGGYHIIVGSFIDSDMAYDYGKKLEAQGMNASVIAPSGDRKFYRLAVQSGSFSDLNDKLAELKGTYGDNIWIVKY